MLKCSGFFFFSFYGPVFRNYEEAVEPPFASTLVLTAPIILLFIHVFSSHFLNFIYTCPFCFQTFLSLYLLLPFLFLLPHHLPHHLFSSMHSPSLSGKILENPEDGLPDRSSRKWGCRKREEALTHEMVWHWWQEGGEKMCMLKIQPEVRPFLFCFSLLLPHWTEDIGLYP